LEPPIKKKVERKRTINMEGQTNRRGLLVDGEKKSPEGVCFEGDLQRGGRRAEIQRAHVPSALSADTNVRTLFGGGGGGGDGRRKDKVTERCPKKKKNGHPTSFVGGNGGGTWHSSEEKTGRGRRGGKEKKSAVTFRMEKCASCWNTCVGGGDLKKNEFRKCGNTGTRSLSGEQSAVLSERKEEQGPSGMVKRNPTDSGNLEQGIRRSTNTTGEENRTYRSNSTRRGETSGSLSQRRERMLWGTPATNPTGKKGKNLVLSKRKGKSLFTTSPVLVASIKKREGKGSRETSGNRTGKDA